MKDQEVIDEMRVALIVAEKAMCNATYDLKMSASGRQIMDAIHPVRKAITLVGWKPTAQYAGERPANRPRNTGGRQCGG